MSGDFPNSHTPGSHLELAIKASQGDDVAAQTLFAEFYKPLRSYVQVRMNPELQSRLDASDIVQETFVEANRRLKDYLQRQSMPLRIWLYKLASKQLGHARVKHLIREKRATSREVPLPDRSSLLLADHLSRNSSPSEHAAKRERDRELAKLINQLGGVEREILLLRHLEGLNYNDIAEILEISVANARQKYARSLLWLRELCVQSGMEDDLL